MPITLNTNVVYTLTSVNVDMIAGEMAAGFSITVNGQPAQSQTIMISGAPLATLFATQATAGQALNDEIALAIYNYVVSNNLIIGTIS
jgi:hypothetical protein